MCGLPVVHCTYKKNAHTSNLTYQLLIFSLDTLDSLVQLSGQSHQLSVPLPQPFQLLLRPLALSLSPSPSFLHSCLSLPQWEQGSV